jgi:hypothetical protein
MSSLATARYELEPAPGSLWLAQDLLNTVAAGGKADLLAELTTATGWASSAADVELTAEDLEELRAFRNDLQGLIAGSVERLQPWVGTATLKVGEGGTVQLQPDGSGAQLLISTVLAAVFEGQQLDTWRRLKTCKNPRCQAAFYDRSRNNSGVWHSLKTCGNPANLRAHRARNRSLSS